jgi:hypothetical protein
MKTRQKCLKADLVLSVLTLLALAYPAMAKDRVAFKGTEPSPN